MLHAHFCDCGECIFMLFLVCIFLLFCFVIYSVLIVVWMSDCWIYLQLLLIFFFWSFFFFWIEAFHIPFSINLKSSKLCLIVQFSFGFLFWAYIYIYIYILCVYKRRRCKGRRWIRASLISDAFRSLNANIIAWATSSLQERTILNP